MLRQSSPDVAPIRDGVFFTVPDALPRGRHSLTREQVQDVQRERLLIATTELLAARGHRGFGHADVAKRAGVSLAAFYDCFASKDECVFAGYDRFIAALVARLSAVDTDTATRLESVEQLLGAYLDTLEADPVVARAYQVEIDALGPPARARRRAALHGIAEYLRQIAQRIAPDAELPWSAFIGIVYAERQLAADLLDTDPEPSFAELRADMSSWLAHVFRERTEDRPDPRVEGGRSCDP
jgi:AcrR family transcriptional regulator